MMTIVKTQKVPQQSTATLSSSRQETRPDVLLEEVKNSLGHARCELQTAKMRRLRPAKIDAIVIACDYTIRQAETIPKHTGCIPYSEIQK